MGCDIHLMAQVKQNGKWKNVATDDTLQINRNYELFGILAGVRRNIIPIVSLRHVPKDFIDGFKSIDGDYWYNLYLTDDVFGRDEYWDEEENSTQQPRFWLGEHSFSWMTLQEMKSYTLWDQKDEDGIIISDYTKNEFNSICEKLSQFGTDENVRIVFGFDN